MQIFKSVVLWIVLYAPSLLAMDQFQKKNDAAYMSFYFNIDSNSADQQIYSGGVLGNYIHSFRDVTGKNYPVEYRLLENERLISELNCLNRGHNAVYHQYIYISNGIKKTTLLQKKDKIPNKDCKSYRKVDFIFYIKEPPSLDIISLFISLMLGGNR